MFKQSEKITYHAGPTAFERGVFGPVLSSRLVIIERFQHFLDVFRLKILAEPALLAPGVPVDLVNFCGHRTGKMLVKFGLIFWAS